MTSSDGKRLASASADTTVRVWDTESGKSDTLEGHSAAVRSVTSGPDGKRLASGSEDGTVKVWNASTGRELLTLSGHPDAVEIVTFSSPFSLVSAGNKTIITWDTTPLQKE